jgi:hypothetical protein
MNADLFEEDINMTASSMSLVTALKLNLKMASKQLSASDAIVS